LFATAQYPKSRVASVKRVVAVDVPVLGEDDGISRGYRERELSGKRRPLVCQLAVSCRCRRASTTGRALSSCPMLAVSRQCQNHDCASVVGDNSRAVARRSPANRVTFALPDQAPGKKRARPDVVGAPDQHPHNCRPMLFQRTSGRPPRKTATGLARMDVRGSRGGNRDPPSCQYEHGTLQLCDVGPRPIVSV